MSGESCLHLLRPQADPILTISSTQCPKIKSCSQHGTAGSKYVRLNVGGTLYYSTVQVLTRQDTLLKSMFSGKMEVFTDKEGECCRRIVWLILFPMFLYNTHSIVMCQCSVCLRLDFDRPLWETLRFDSQLLAGWKCNFAEEQAGCHGALHWGKVLSDPGTGGLVSTCATGKETMLGQKLVSGLYEFMNVTFYCIDIHGAVWQWMHCVPYEASRIDGKQSLWFHCSIGKKLLSLIKDNFTISTSLEVCVQQYYTELSCTTSDLHPMLSHYFIFISLVLFLRNGLYTSVLLVLYHFRLLHCAGVIILVWVSSLPQCPHTHVPN